ERLTDGLTGIGFPKLGRAVVAACQDEAIIHAEADMVDRRFVSHDFTHQFVRREVEQARILASGDRQYLTVGTNSYGVDRTSKLQGRSELAAGFPTPEAHGFCRLLDVVPSRHDQFAVRANSYRTNRTLMFDDFTEGLASTQIPQARRPFLVLVSYKEGSAIRTENDFTDWPVGKGGPDKLPSSSRPEPGRTCFSGVARDRN